MVNSWIQYAYYVIRLKLYIRTRLTNYVLFKGRESFRISSELQYSISRTVKQIKKIILITALYRHENLYKHIIFTIFLQNYQKWKYLRTHFQANIFSEHKNFPKISKFPRHEQIKKGQWLQTGRLIINQIWGI